MCLSGSSRRRRPGPLLVRQPPHGPACAHRANIRSRTAWRTAVFHLEGKQLGMLALLGQEGASRVGVLIFIVALSDSLFSWSGHVAGTRTQTPDCTAVSSTQTRSARVAQAAGTLVNVGLYKLHQRCPPRS